MEQWRKNLYILWFGCFLNAMSYTLVVPFLPLFLQELDVTSGIETWSGLTLSASFMVSAIVSPIWGSLADRYGRKVMVIRAGLGMGAIYILQFFVTTPVQLLVLRLLNGLFSGFIPSSTALIATNTPEEHIGTSLGILQTAQASGSIMGPLIGGVMGQYLGFRATFLTAGSVLMMCTIMVAMSVRETAARRPDQKIEIGKDIRMALSNSSLKIMLLCAAFIQTALTILQPVLSLQVAKLGGAETASLSSGLVYSAAGIAAVFGAPLFGSRGRKFGYKRILVSSLLVAGAMNLPQAFVKSLILFGILRFLVGFFTAGVQLSVNAVTAKSVPLDFRGRAFGILQSSNQLGSMMGPIIGGVTGTLFGLESTFIVTAVILVLGSLVTQRLLPTDDQRAHLRLTNA